MPLTKEEKQARLEARREEKRIAKELVQIESEKNQKPIKSISINIEWKKSRTWGMNPYAEAFIKYQDGSYYRDPTNYTASGCGYDKKSTVIADIFNSHLKYKLYQQYEGEKPYGIYYYNGTVSKDGYRPRFEGGVGTSCYYKIANFIGGNFEHISSGKSFDVFKYTNN